ncbi:energy transducer TonB [Shewanella frigidimarina]|uniref:energy transducer TonB n=1 Tax=Shewanella frigidimarina TaxID=56812 RepID=UPI003D794E01
MTPKRYFAFGCLTIFVQVGVLAAQNNQQTIPLISGIVTGSHQAVKVSIMMPNNRASISATSFKQRPLDSVNPIQVQPSENTTESTTESTTTKIMSLNTTTNATKSAVISTIEMNKPHDRKMYQPITKMAHKIKHVQQNTDAESIVKTHSDVLALSSSELNSVTAKTPLLVASQGAIQHTVALPKPTFSVPPNQPYYPKKARRRGLEGTATVEVMFNQLGEQLSLTLVNSSGFSLLDAAALDAVEKWQFAAPTSSEAYAYTVRIPVKFALN